MLVKKTKKKQNDVLFFSLSKNFGSIFFFFLNRFNNKKKTKKKETHMRLIELFNALSSDEPFKKAVIEADYLEIQLSVAGEVQETAFKEFISKLPLINSLSSQKDWDIISYCTTHDSEVGSHYKKLQLFWLQIGIMLTKVNTPQENKDLVSDTESTIWPTKEEAVAALVQLCISIGTTITGLFFIVTLALSQAGVSILTNLAIPITRYLFTTLAPAVSAVGSAVSAVGSGVSSGVIIASEAAVNAGALAIEFAAAIDLGAVIVEGVAVAAPLLTVEVLLRYLFRLQMELFQRHRILEEGEIEAFLFDEEVEVEAGAADTVSTSTFIAYRDMVRRYVNAISANEGVNERIVLEQLDLIVARRLQIESNYASIAGEEDFELSIIEPPRTQIMGDNNLRNQEVSEVKVKEVEMYPEPFKML